MLRALLLGVLSAFFFSSTFVLNRAMSLEGGHWAWTATLRYAYMLLMLMAWLGITRQGAVLRGVRDALRSRPLFWMLTGSVGFGVFYAPLCYSATRMPGWVVAATWQATILATPLVLLLFGRKVPTRGLAFTGLIFLGIVLVNLEQAGGFGDAAGLILGVLPVLLAALAYPLGNQLAWEARSDAARGGPEAANPALESGPGLVLLLCLGSLPFWLALLLVVRPETPADGQWVQTALVAFLAGVVATSLSCTPATAPAPPMSWPPWTPRNPWRWSSPSSGRSCSSTPRRPASWAFRASRWWRWGWFSTWPGRRPDARRAARPDSAAPTPRRPRSESRPALRSPPAGRPGG